MLLVIDIGNTNIVMGVFEGDQLKADWRLQTKKKKTSDEYGILFLELFKARGLNLDDVDGVILSSVVPPLKTIFEQMCTRYLNTKILVVGPGVKTGMPILYENPREVGADRIVNAVAAYHKFQRPLIIVDFGTAITFDVVSEKGEYMGGVICPGIGISMDALFIHTAKLPRFELKKPANIIGRNTVQSMQSGILYGFIGLVDEMNARLTKELGDTPKIIATGGMAPTIVPLTRSIEETYENLTLDGLRIIWEMNRK